MAAVSAASLRNTRVTVLSWPMALVALGLSGCVAGRADAPELARRSAALTGKTSTLWGEAGEAFDPKGRLMDWSYAGYHAGEAELPEPAVTLNAHDYGATGDGKTEDTEALTAALAAAKKGDVVFLPAGTYLLKKELNVPNGVVLRGAGSAETILDVPVSLTDLYGNPGLAAGKQSSYAFGNAFIKAKGGDGGKELAKVTAAAKRGDTKLTLSTTQGLTVGQWVHVDQTDVNGSLIKRLHLDLVAGGDDDIGDKAMEHYSRVKAVLADGIELERPLPVDVELMWSPHVLAMAPKGQEIGVEHLSIHFPETTYGGHFKEAGYNGVELSNVVHSWVRDVHVINGDYGVSITGSHFVTVKDVVVATTNNRSGHHALNCGHGGDNLFIGFDLQIKFVHDLTVEWYTTGNVFTQGKGLDLCLDHHRAAPYTTLWTELDLGKGSRPFASGGANNRGPHTAAHDTLWNVHAAKDLALPPADYGPGMTFVGYQTKSQITSNKLDWFLEDIAPADLAPQNLWLAMREKRLGATPPAGDGDAGTSADAGGASHDDAGSMGGPANGDGDKAPGDGDAAGDGDGEGDSGDGNDGSSNGGSPGDGDAHPGKVANAGCSLSARQGRCGWLMLASLAVITLIRRRRSTPSPRGGLG